MREENSNGTLNAYIVRSDEICVGDHFGYKIVAVIHNDHFWTAYMGLTDWSDWDVATGGDTVSEDIAEKLFPAIASRFMYNR
jgi:hypothetical protein